MADFPYRRSGSEAVTALVETVRSDDDFVAGCLVAGGAHGYSMELEYMQRRDGTFRYRVAEDVQGTISSQERTLAFDIVHELARARDAKLDGVTLPDNDRGRRTLIVLADRDGGVWVDAPAPGRGARPEERNDGPIERVFRVAGF